MNYFLINLLNDNINTFHGNINNLIIIENMFSKKREKLIF